MRNPIAKAIIDRGQQQQLTPLSLSGFSAVPGAGLQGIVGGEHIYMGHLHHEKILKKLSTRFNQNGDLSSQC